jgi:hypothetical protein
MRIAAYVGLALISVMISSTTLKAQTLLETVAWLNNGGFYNVEEFKQLPNGTLIAPDYKTTTANGSKEYWKVADQSNCIIEKSYPSSRIEVTYYLNNFLPDFKITIERDGLYAMIWSGESPIVCVVQSGNKSCNTTLTFEAIDYDTSVRFKRAFDYIFHEYCHLARYSKPF